MREGTVLGGWTFKGTTRTRAPVSLLGERRPEDSLLVGRPVPTREAGEGGRRGQGGCGRDSFMKNYWISPSTLQIPGFSFSASLQGPPPSFTREQPLSLWRLRAEALGSGIWVGMGQRLSRGSREGLHLQQAAPAPPRNDGSVVPRPRPQQGLSSSRFQCDPVTVKTSG